MPRNPNGRPPKIDYGTLKRLYEEFKQRNPTGSKKEFSQEVGISYSRVRTILSKPVDEIRLRKQGPGAQDEGAEEKTQEQVDGQKKGSGLVFYDPWE